MRLTVICGVEVVSVFSSLLLFPRISQNLSSLMFSKLLLLFPPSFLMMEIVLHTLSRLLSGDLNPCLQPPSIITNKIIINLLELKVKDVDSF